MKENVKDLSNEELAETYKYYLERKNRLNKKELKYLEELKGEIIKRSYDLK